MGEPKMGLWNRIFGRTSSADERAKADALFDDESFQDARLAYERALDRAERDDEAMRAHCEERMGECLDRMAEARIAEADTLAAGGQADLAEEELHHAMELARDPEIVRRARRRLETLEESDAAQRAELPDEMTDEDRWAILAGTWESAQLEEYDTYGERFRTALLRLHEEHADRVAAAESRAEDPYRMTENTDETGLSALEGILENAGEPVYLWLEVGRARAASEDFEGAEEALRAFLALLEGDEGGEAQLSARASLAALRDRAEDEEGAVDELSAAMEAFPDDPRPFFLLGQFLRHKSHIEEAVEVLEAGRGLLDEDRFDWRYYQEAGLAHHEAGQVEIASDYLDRVIGFFVERRRHDGELDYPPEAALALASIYEDAGRDDKAADLFRALAGGSDRENHLHYHREAARLLLRLDLTDEARRMLSRAHALATEDPEAHAEIEAQLTELEN